jgi:hypothetical protein
MVYGADAAITEHLHCTDQQWLNWRSLKLKDWFIIQTAVPIIIFFMAIFLVYSSLSRPNLNTCTTPLLDPLIIHLTRQPTYTVSRWLHLSAYDCCVLCFICWAQNCYDLYSMHTVNNLPTSRFFSTIQGAPRLLGYIQELAKATGSF